MKADHRYIITPELAQSIEILVVGWLANTDSKADKSDATLDAVYCRIDCGVGKAVSISEKEAVTLAQVGQQILTQYSETAADVLAAKTLLLMAIDVIADYRRDHIAGEAKV